MTGAITSIDVPITVDDMPGTEPMIGILPMLVEVVLMAGSIFSGIKGITKHDFNWVIMSIIMIALFVMMMPIMIQSIEIIFKAS